MRSQPPRRLGRRRRAAPPSGGTALSPGRSSGRVAWRWWHFYSHSERIQIPMRDERRPGGEHGDSGPAWRQRAVPKSLSAARSRAEQRVQRLLDAAFALIHESGTTQFTIQEVVDRSKQSLRGFYQYFESKDELLFALLEETIRESLKDLREAVESESKPIDRLRAFTIRLHEWCEPLGTRRKRGAHNRVPISEFSLQLALKDPDRLTAAMLPISRMLLDAIKAAVAAGSLKATD